jgi:hypothetical protein
MNKTEQSKALSKTKNNTGFSDVKKKIQQIHEKTIEEEILEMPLQNI